MEERGTGGARRAGIDDEKQADVVIPFNGPDGAQVLVTLRTMSSERSGCVVADAKHCVRTLAEAFERERMAAAPERAPGARLDDAVYRSWAYDS